MLTKLTIIVESAGPVLPEINNSPIRLSCVEQTLASDGTICSNDVVCSVRAMPMDREIIESLSVPEHFFDIWPSIRGQLSYLEATYGFGEYKVHVCVDRRKKEIVYRKERGQRVPYIILARLDGSPTSLPPSTCIGDIHIVDASKWRIVPKLEKRSSMRQKHNWASFKMDH